LKHDLTKPLSADERYDLVVSNWVARYRHAQINYGGGYTGQTEFSGRALRWNGTERRPRILYLLSGLVLNHRQSRLIRKTGIGNADLGLGLGKL